ncbi:MAG: SHOCT domain-containing protein [Nitrospinaceae bacterium]
MAVLTLGLAACAGTQDPPKTLKKGKVKLTYHDIREDKELSGLPIQHPLATSRDILDTHLRSLYFENLGMFSKTRPVFPPDQVDQLSGLLTKALKHARATRFISFEVEGPQGVTQGDLLASNGKLLWRILKIQGNPYIKRRWARAEPAWRLAPGPGQAFFVKKILFERKITNWIVADLNLPLPPGDSGNPQTRRSVTPRRPQPGTPPPASVRSPAEDELERKLRILKNLRDKDLIDPEEYQNRRRKLLDQNL